MYSTEILLNTATIRNVNLTEMTQILRRGKHRIKSHYSDKLKTTKQTLKTSKHSTEFTYSDFPCHFKENRDKLAVSNRGWKCKRGKRLTITIGAKFRQRGRPREKIRPVGRIVKSWTGHVCKISQSNSRI